MNKESIQCPCCGLYFDSYVNFKTHIYNCDSDNILNIQCTICGRKYKKVQSLKYHIINCANQHGFGKHDKRIILSDKSHFKLSKKAFKSLLQQFELIPNYEINDCEEFFMQYQDDINDLIDESLKV